MGYHTWDVGGGGGGGGSLSVWSFTAYHDAHNHPCPTKDPIPS